MNLRTNTWTGWGPWWGPWWALDVVLVEFEEKQHNTLHLLLNCTLSHWQWEHRWLAAGSSSALQLGSENIVCLIAEIVIKWNKGFFPPAHPHLQHYPKSLCLFTAGLLRSELYLTVKIKRKKVATNYRVPSKASLCSIVLHKVNMSDSTVAEGRTTQRKCWVIASNQFPLLIGMCTLMPQVYCQQLL